MPPRFSFAPTPEAEAGRSFRGQRKYSRMAQREADRTNRNNAAVAMGGRKGMSAADQDSLGASYGGDSTESALSSTKNDAMRPRLTGRQPKVEAQANADVANSRIDPNINRSGATALQPRPVQPVAGKIVPNATADALLGPTVGANGFGTGSVRFAGKNEKAGPSQVTDTGIVGQSPAPAFDEVAARTALYKTHPELWQEGSPQNIAFNNHIKAQLAKGLAPEAALQSAHENAGQILAPFDPEGKVADRVTTPKPDIANAETQDLPKGPLAQRAGEALRGLSNTGSGIGSAIASIPSRVARGALDIASQFRQGLTGESPDLATSRLATGAASLVPKVGTPPSWNPDDPYSPNIGERVPGGLRTTTSNRINSTGNPPLPSSGYLPPRPTVNPSGGVGDFLGGAVKMAGDSMTSALPPVAAVRGVVSGVNDMAQAGSDLMNRRASNRQAFQPGTVSNPRKKEDDFSFE